MRTIARLGLRFIYAKESVKARIYYYLFRSAFASLGGNTSIMQPFRLGCPERISIGRNVYIGARSWLQAIPGSEPATQNLIEIADDTSISGECTIAACHSVRIGRSVLIGRFVHISDHAHEYQNTQIPVKHQGITEGKAVVIEDGCWIGQGVVICPGAKIGRNAVIGANSIVKGSIPPHTLAAGAPLKLIRAISSIT